MHERNRTGVAIHSHSEYASSKTIESTKNRRYRPIAALLREIRHDRIKFRVVVVINVAVVKSCRQYANIAGEGSGNITDDRRLGSDCNQVGTSEAVFVRWTQQWRMLAASLFSSFNGDDEMAWIKGEPFSAIFSISPLYLHYRKLTLFRSWRGRTIESSVFATWSPLCFLVVHFQLNCSKRNVVNSCKQYGSMSRKGSEALATVDYAGWLQPAWNSWGCFPSSNTTVTIFSPFIFEFQ